jgi:hypothetical protein
MSDSKATYVATCYAFVPTDSMLKRRRLARKAKERRDPGVHVMAANLAKDVMTALLAFEGTGDLHLEAWFGTADRLAYAHPSGVVDQLMPATQPTDRVGAIAFITAVGPRSYWPEAEATAYRAALDAFALGGTIEDLALAAKSLVGAARRRESAWSLEEWQFRIAAGITAWVYWDDEPGARRST